MTTILGWSKALSRGFALLGFAGLLLLAVMTALDVLFRWLFQLPIQGVNDVSSVVMAVVIAACIPANLAFKQNIKVEVAGVMGGPRFHALLDALASLLSLLFIVLMAWMFVPYSMSLYDTGDRTWVLAWPVWPWWSFATVMICLAVPVQALVLLEDLRGLTSPRPI